MDGVLDTARLDELVESLGRLRERLVQDERKLDALLQRIQDEAWQADVRVAAMDDQAEAEYRQITRELWQTIDQELERLRSLSERNPT